MKKPVPPSEPRSGPSRPGINGKAVVAIPADAFRDICKKLRADELLGAAAAEALEAAAGSIDGGEQQPAEGKSPKVLRTKVAMAREEPDEIPDLRMNSKKASVREYVSDMEHQHDLESMATHVAKDAEEPPELNLNPKQNHMRTDLEMWVMDEIPAVYGVDDSDELDEALQEDAQACRITELIANSDREGQEKTLNSWLKDAPDEEKKTAFAEEVLDRVQKIQDAGGKKKKKKKVTEA